MPFHFAIRYPLGILVSALAIGTAVTPRVIWADSVNSPNITMNVDTNRSTGAGAGNVTVTVNTITLAETTLPEYSAGSGKSFTIKVRPGYQLEPSSPVTAQSGTFGINGGALNGVASITPTGAENESLTFSLTSAGANVDSVQNIIRVNGIKLKIASAAGAAGPAQSTLQLTTSTMGGAFTNQNIVSASITRGAAHRLQFAAQPGDTEAGQILLPQVKIVDFGGNVLTNENRTISLALQSNPGSATLQGTTSLGASSGIATWSAGNNLLITTASSGYTLRATHSGANFLGSDSTDSSPFAITASDPGGLEITAQPGDIAAGDDILISLRVVDEFGNLNSTGSFPVSIDAAANPGGWPLLVDSSLTKTTVNGLISWGADDNLRITKAVTGYSLVASGLGAPVTSNTFTISPGTANRVRFVQQPLNVQEKLSLSPAPSAEITDEFGNRVNTSSSITLGLSAPLCNATLSPLSPAASAGLATFDPVTIDGPCEDVALSATVARLIGGISDTFDVRAEDAFPISISTALLKKGKIFQFGARGTFKISTATIDDPTRKGATLTVTGSTGRVRYVLPRSGWKKTGKDSFRFRGAKCEQVIISKKSISASCTGKTGSLTIPESDLSIKLAIGKGTEQFCGLCGGSSRGNENKSFRRVACGKPESCD